MASRPLAAPAPTPSLACSRRAALAAAALVLAPAAPVWALAPPRGRIEPLVPILQGRILLAELAATASAPPEQRSAVQWSSVLTSLRRSPLANFRASAREYQDGLEYSRTLTADDKKLCFARLDDAACAQSLVSADLDFRGLLINSCLTDIGAVDDELSYLARCQQARATGAAPGGGITCAATDDTDELRDATNKAAQSFDAFFDSVGASEIELAMDAVRRRDRVREIVPLRDG